MSKLFMILYVAGKIAGTWGPLPYDTAECERRAAEGNAIIAQAKGKPEIIAKMKATGATAPLEQWEFACEQRTVRPELGERKEPIDG